MQTGVSLTNIYIKIVVLLNIYIYKIGICYYNWSFLTVLYLKFIFRNRASLTWCRRSRRRCTCRRARPASGSTSGGSSPPRHSRTSLCSSSSSTQSSSCARSGRETVYLAYRYIVGRYFYSFKSILLLMHEKIA